MTWMNSFLTRRIGAGRAFWILVAALLLAGAFSLAVQSRKAPRVVHAQTGCSVATLNGTYGYTLSGFYFDNFGNTGLFSAAGNLTADGQGNLTGQETQSATGSIIRAAAYTGTYTVNADCSGTLTPSSQAIGGTFAYDFVITDAGTGLHLVEADRGTNITGAARKQ